MKGSISHILSQMDLLKCLVIRYNVSNGVYILKVISLKLTYDKIYLTIKNDQLSAYKINQLTGTKVKISLPIKIGVGKPIIYFDKKSQFNITDYLKSPMGIIICVTVALMLCMNVMPNMEDLKNADNPGTPN